MKEQAWFIRKRRFHGYRLHPNRPVGWAIVAIFAIGTIGLAAIHAVKELRGSALLAWTIILGMWIVGFLVVAHLKSVAEVGRAKTGRERQRSRNRERQK